MTIGKLHTIRYENGVCNAKKLMVASIVYFFLNYTHSSQCDIILLLLNRLMPFYTAAYYETLILRGK